MYGRILIDNNAPEGLECEWGLSVYIEYNEQKILLDAGQSEKFAENAATLGIPLADIDFAVLSHAHYDHANGLGAFLDANKTAPLYLRAGSGENCYKKSKGEYKYIGIKRGLLSTYEDRIRYISGDFSPAKGIYLLPHKSGSLEAQGRRSKMYLKEMADWKVDEFQHEQSLVFETEKGLVVFNSCCHAGADLIIRETEQTFPGRKIHAIIGGFHLFAAKEKDIYAFSERVLATGIEKVYTGHCTGDLAMEILQEELGDRMEALYSGLEFEF